MLSAKHVLDRPIRSLALVFLLWKVLLLAIALLSTLGPAYDTSASLLYDDTGNTRLTKLVVRLTSWDAIYYVEAARRGRVFEQEWAFGSGLPSNIRSIVQPVQNLGVPLAAPEPIVGALLAHFYHFCSVGFLWLLVSLVTGDGLRAFVAGLLHIVSPAGLFLSAPYSEASFSALSFAGLCLLVWSFETTSLGLKNALVLLSGSIFERALRHRSNGIFNGIPILAAFLQAGVAFVKAPRWVHIREVVVFGIAGVWMSLGLLDPQVEAFFEYCSPRRNGVPRPWCSARIPSIYSFVQDHYWDNGFLRYWTFSNLPLFLLASPMIFILSKSGWDVLRTPAAYVSGGQSSPSTGVSLITRAAAFAQLLLAILTLLDHHVQVITRISSGYPIWYLWLSTQIVQGDAAKGKGFVYFMVMYAAVQAVLFASFLPPA